jgi:hypothetical protein
MKKKSGIEKLLSDVLAMQQEDGRGAELTEERVRDVLLGTESFSDAEEHLLANSPLARHTYAAALEEVEIEREAYRQRCERAGLHTSTGNLLAAATGQYPLVIPSDDFLVTVRPHPIDGGWVITLALSEQFRRITGPADVLTLVDDQNVTWIRGQLNVYGEIHSYCWPYPESPAERARRPGFALRVLHA